MRLLNNIKNPEFIALLGLGIMVVLLPLFGKLFTFESFTRILILIGLFCGYLNLSKNRNLSFLLRLIIPLLIATVFLLYFIISKGTKPGFLIILLLHGIALSAFGIGMAIRFLKINPLYKMAILQGFVILFIFATSRWYGVGWFAVCTFLAFILSSIYLGSHKPDKPFVVSIILFTVVFLMPLLESSIIGFANNVPITLLGGVFSYFTIRQMMKSNHSVIRRFSPLLISILIIPLIWLAQENYAHILTPIRNDIPVETVQLNLLDKEGFQIQENQEQTSVYFFWSTTCGSCRKEFPYFSELALKHKDHKNIKFYAVLVEFKASDSSAFNYEIKNNYAFEWARIPDGQTVYENLIKDGFPKLTIIGKDKKVLYNGFVKYRPWLNDFYPDRYLN